MRAPAVGGGRVSPGGLGGRQGEPPPCGYSALFGLLSGALSSPARARAAWLGDGAARAVATRVAEVFGGFCLGRGRVATRGTRADWGGCKGRRWTAEPQPPRARPTGEPIFHRRNNGDTRPRKPRWPCRHTLHSLPRASSPVPLSLTLQSPTPLPRPTPAAAGRSASAAGGVHEWGGSGVGGTARVRVRGGGVSRALSARSRHVVPRGTGIPRSRGRGAARGP